MAYVLGGALTILFGVLAPQIPLKSRALVQRVEEGAGMGDIAAAAWLLIGVAVLVQLVRFGSRYILFRAARQLEYEMRNDLCGHLQTLPQSYFTAHRTGDLMSRAVNDVNSVRAFLGMGFMHLINTPVLYAAMMVTMVAIDWRVTLWVLAPYLLFVPLGRFWGRRIFQASLEVQEQLGDLSTVVQENAAGVLVVRSYAMETAENQRFYVENDRLYRKHLRLAMVDALLQPAIMTLPALSQIVLVFAGGHAVMAGTMNVSDFIAF